MTQNSNATKYKLVYLSDQRLPAKKANTGQIVNTVSALASQGAEVTLIIPCTLRDLLTPKKKFKQKIMDYYKVTTEFGLIRIPHFPFAPFKVDKITHGLFAPFWAAATGHDIAYTRNSLPIFLFYLLGKRILFEAYRLYGENKKSLTTHLAVLTKTSDRIIMTTFSDPSRESLISCGAEASKLRVMHNGFNPKPFEPELTKSEARKLVGWKDGETIALFIGRIDIDKGIESILQLAARTPDVVYSLLGFSQLDSENWVLRVAKERGLENIRKYPWVAVDTLAHYLFAADILIIPPTAEPLMKHGTTVMPIKTYQYMAANRPILAPALPDVKTVLNETNAVVVEPDNTDAAEAGIRKILDDPKFAESIAAQAKKDSEDYSWERRAGRIISYINEMF